MTVETKPVGADHVSALTADLPADLPAGARERVEQLIDRAESLRGDMERARAA